MVRKNLIYAVVITSLGARPNVKSLQLMTRCDKNRAFFFEQEILCIYAVLIDKVYASRRTSEAGKAMSKLLSATKVGENLSSLRDTVQNLKRHFELPKIKIRRFGIWRT